MNSSIVQKQLEASLIREGIVYRRSKFLKEWEERWAVLTHNHLLIFQDSGKKSLNDSIDLRKVKEYSSYLMKEDNVSPSSLKIQSENSHLICFQSTEEKWSWMVTIQRLMDFKAVGPSHYNSKDSVQTKGFKSLQQYSLTFNRQSNPTEPLTHKREEEYKKEIERLNKVVDEQEKYFQKMLKEKYMKLNTIEAKMIEKQKKYEELSERLLSNSRKQAHQAQLEESRIKKDKLKISHELVKFQTRSLQQYELLQSIVGRGVSPSEQSHILLKDHFVQVYNPQVEQLSNENKNLKEKLDEVRSKQQLIKDKVHNLSKELEEKAIQLQLKSTDQKKTVQPYQNQLLESVIGRVISASEQGSIKLKPLPLTTYNPQYEHLKFQNKNLKKQLEQTFAKESLLQKKLNQLVEQKSALELALKDKDQKGQVVINPKQLEMAFSFIDREIHYSQQENIALKAQLEINNADDRLALQNQRLKKQLVQVLQKQELLQQKVSELSSELAESQLRSQRNKKQAYLGLDEPYLQNELVQSITGVYPSHSQRENIIKLSQTAIKAFHSPPISLYSIENHMKDTVSSLQNQIDNLKSQITKANEELIKSKAKNIANEKIIAQLRLPLTQHVVKSYFKADLVQSIVGSALSYEAENNLQLNVCIIQQENPQNKKIEVKEVAQNVEESSLWPQYCAQKKQIIEKGKIIQELSITNLRLSEEIKVLAVSKEQLRAQVKQLQKGLDEQSVIFLEYRKKIKANAAIQQANRTQAEKQLEGRLQELYTRNPTQRRVLEDRVKQEKKQSEVHKNNAEKIQGKAKKQGRVATDMKAIFQSSKGKANEVKK